MIEITHLASAVGPLTKRIHLAPDGKLISDGSACVMPRGTAKRLPLGDMKAFAEHIANLKPNQAIALGSLRLDLPDEVQITTEADLRKLNGKAPLNLVSRTASHISYRPDHHALALIDFDTKGLRRSVAECIERLGGFWAALVAVLPELSGVARVVRTSTSSGIIREDTSQHIRGSDGVHVFLLVQDGADVERFLRTLHDRCWLAGFGWMMVGAGGQLLERSLIDRMVYAAERLVFEAAPTLAKPLRQDASRRRPRIEQGDPADTRAICPSLTLTEQARLRDIKAAERARLGADADTSWCRRRHRQKGLYQNAGSPHRHHNRL